MGFFDVFKKKGVGPQTDAKLLADIDAILNQPVSFKLRGKIYVIRPLTVEQFLECSKVIEQLAALDKKTDLTPEYVIGLYDLLLKSVGVKISKKELELLTSQQLVGIFNLVAETITGKAFVEKKTLTKTQSA